MKKLLIIDDESSIQFLFSRMFKKEVKEGLYELSFAENGKEALDFLEHRDDIDLIISDINMPIMDGFELLKTSKQKYPKLPVIMASAYTDKERMDLAKELGAQEYLAKPINFPELKEYLKSFF
jgi:CheY-like chemotaxis protein